MAWMDRIPYIFPVILCFALNATAQGDLEVYRGNQAFMEGDYEDAKKHYLEALVQNPESYKGTYNLGNTDYRQENYEQALLSYQQAIDKSATQLQKAEAYHNLGNTFLQSGKLEESIEAYKQALRIDPALNDTRYNLAYALQQLREQQQNQEQNKDQQQENEENQDKKNEEKKNQDQDKDQEGQEKEKKNQQDQEKGENKDGEQQKDREKGEEQQPRPVNLSPREAEQMLEAARNEDQRIQMMLQKKKNPGDPKKIEKDW